MASPPPATADAILFRPSKRRKVYRQRAADDDDEATPASPPSVVAQLSPPAPSNQQSLDELIASASSTVKDGGEDVEAMPVSMAEILRLRKMKKRTGGVEFRPESQSQLPKIEEQALVQHTEASEETGGLVDNGVPRKFAPQTGAVGDVNRHMMAYIDSELAKRRALEGTHLQSCSTPQIGSSKGLSEHKSTAKESTDVQRQPAALGKLQEVDLGDDARSRNVELTNRAKRILDGESVDDDPVNGKGKGKPGKVRLGPDGKPWRGRKRRTSEDIARDKLVEAVFRENRLEIYEEPVIEEATTGNDEAADDRIAEAFRKEFMDSVSQRQRKKTGPSQPAARTAAGKKEEEIMKGPKLGGSRTARAAMREAMLKAKK